MFVNCTDLFLTILTDLSGWVCWFTGRGERGPVSPNTYVVQAVNKDMRGYPTLSFRTTLR